MAAFPKTCLIHESVFESEDQCAVRCPSLGNVLIIMLRLGSFPASKAFGGRCKLENNSNVIFQNYR